MVRGATPDVVLTGVELLPRLDERAGSATSWSSTSAAPPPTCTPSSSSTRRTAELAREVVATTPVTRTVEGDLGMRWSAVTTVEAAGLDDLREAAAATRRDDPGFLPDTDDGAATTTRRSPAAAVGLALRRHAGRSRVVVSPEGRVVERTGKDLREVDLLVGSGGVLRHGRPGVAERVLGPSDRRRLDGGWQLPERAAGRGRHRLRARRGRAARRPSTRRRRTGWSTA